MGGHKTTILEFPLPEAIVAVFYKLFGPSHFWARLVFLLFFLGALRYFYLIIRLLADKDLAEVATLIYLVMPLGIFYSRAIHIDFAAVCMAHGMAYHYMRGLGQENWRHLLAGALWGVLAFLTKAPYAFYLFLPLLFFIYKEGKFRYAFQRLYFFIIPVICFIPWQQHVHAVNSAAPDWFFIPDYKKFVNKWAWYFGTWEMRGMVELWGILYGRIKYEVVASWGLVPLVIGFFLKPRSFAANTMRFWAVGTMLYTFIFFNLNLVHNYYQIPVMAPAAFFMAVFISELGKWLSAWRRYLGPVLVLVLVLAFAGQAIRLTEGYRLGSSAEKHFGEYFTVSQVPVQAGAAIQEMTPKGSLVIVTYGGLDPRAPMILYRARRNGWSIPQKDLYPQLIEDLQKEGASHLAVIYTNPYSPELANFLKKFSFQEKVLEGLDKVVFVYNLDKK